MGSTTIAIFLLSASVVLLAYSIILQKRRMDVLQTVLETHILIESQMADAIRNVIMEEATKEQ